MHAPVGVGSAEAATGEAVGSGATVAATGEFVGSGDTGAATGEPVGSGDTGAATGDVRRFRRYRGCDWSVCRLGRYRGFSIAAADALVFLRYLDQVALNHVVDTIHCHTLDFSASHIIRRKDGVKDGIWIEDLLACITNTAWFELGARCSKQKPKNECSVKKLHRSSFGSCGGTSRMWLVASY